MQAARNLHDEIRAALCRQTQNVFDNATSFHPGQHVFDDHAGAGEETIEEPGSTLNSWPFVFFGAAGSAPPLAHSPENPCPSRASHWWDSISGGLRRRSC